MIKIVITGPAASGKSTLAWKIRNFLRSEGIQSVDVIDPEETFEPDMNGDRFNSFKYFLDVEIETLPTNKMIDDGD